MCYATDMYKKTDEIVNSSINQLLLERRMPLSKEKEQEVLTSLSRALVEEGRFLLLCSIRDDRRNDSEVSMEYITQTPLLLTEEDKLLPVFTAQSILEEFNMPDKEALTQYVCDLLDLLIYLEVHPDVAGAVINPMVDDLVLSKSFIMRILNAFQ